MKYGYCLLFILFLSCIPKNDNVLLDEENNKIDTMNFNPEIVECASTIDSNGNELIRLKQKLKNSDDILNKINNYYTLIRNDGSIIINESIHYPYISNTKIINYEHISRQYGGAHVDISEFTILLENNQTIKTRIFFPYESSVSDDIYYFSNDNYSATKGYYEFGLEKNPLEITNNIANIEIKTFSDHNVESYHKYIYLGPISKYYNSEYHKVIDRYSYFLIDIYSKEDTNEMKIYSKKIIDNIKYW